MRRRVRLTRPRLGKFRQRLRLVSNFPHLPSSRSIKFQFHFQLLLSFLFSGRDVFCLYRFGHFASLSSGRLLREWYNVFTVPYRWNLWIFLLMSIKRLEKVFTWMAHLCFGYHLVGFYCHGIRYRSVFIDSQDTQP
jgi:hypothetical protein